MVAQGAAVDWPLARDQPLRVGPLADLVADCPSP